MIGGVKGTSFDFAEKHENTPIAVFLIEEFDPEVNASFAGSGLESFRDVLSRGAVVRLQDETLVGAVAYEIDAVDPHHGITQNAALVRVKPEKVFGYDAPPDNPVCLPTS